MVAAALALAVTPPRLQLYIHVMPWFEASEKDLGWHWRMNKTAAQVRESGEVASHFQPLTGPYDSMDPDILELQLGWMKAAGFDGVLANWYGTQPHFDYPVIHERTKKLFEVATEAGLKIGVAYEDQTVRNAINHGLLAADQGERVARETGAFLKENWLSRPNWIKLGGKPAVLVFGPQHFGDKEWGVYRQAGGSFNLITLWHPKPYGDGVFGWPTPSKGFEGEEEFRRLYRDQPTSIPVAYPRFVDFYEEGGQKGYPDMPDREGRTYRETLANALSWAKEAVQVATWNDWQEGTQIEPSREHRLRDLEATQEARRKIDRAFPFRKEDLQLPWLLYQARKRKIDSTKLDQAREALFRSKPLEAKKILDALS